MTRTTSSAVIRSGVLVDQEREPLRTDTSFPSGPLAAPAVPDSDVGRPEKELIGGRGLTKRYGDHEVLSNVDISVQRGERICIVGPSGSGKSTLLRCLNLLVAPSAGELYFQRTCIGRWPEPKGRARRNMLPLAIPTAGTTVRGGRQARAQTRRQAATLPVGKDGRVDIKAFRSRVGMVFQHFELFPHLTVADNISLGPRHVLGIDKTTARERSQEMLQRVGLASFADARPRSLSGGQQQRVAIARALAMSPEVILMDEPTSALDWEMVKEVLDIMTQLAEAGMTMIVVTHELEFARKSADRILVVDGGKIIEEGSPKELFAEPKLDRTRQFLSA
jgi:polar amino acid transport system ATP-binding protein